MSALTLAGPSNSLRFNAADCERTINWMPAAIEGQGKGGQAYYLKQCPGLRLLCNLGAGPVNRLVEVRGELFASVGESLVKIPASLTPTTIGPIAADSYYMAANNTQLAVASASAITVYDLDSGALASTIPNYLGTSGLDVLDGYGIFAEPGTTTFYISANQDFTSIDPLQYASAEGTQGNIVGLLVKNRELILLKDRTSEVWYDAGASDFPLARNDGASIETGCAAGRTFCKVGGVAYWLGKDASGENIVFGMSAYAPIRISTHALEEQLAGIADLSGASAFVYNQEGQTFYVLQVPGLATTWVYDVSVSLWHERAEWNDGFSQWRPTCHAFAYGMNIVGDESGNLYEVTPTVNAYDTAPLVRDRITPHVSLPSLSWRRIGSMQIDCDVGAGLAEEDAKLMLRYSNDGGRTWGNWRFLSLGQIGEYKTRVRATRLGTARDRVWHIRVTDNVRCNLLAAILNEV